MTYFMWVMAVGPDLLEDREKDEGAVKRAAALSHPAVAMIDQVVVDKGSWQRVWGGSP